MVQGEVLLSYSTVHLYSLLPLVIQVTHWEYCCLFQELPDHIYSNCYAFAPGSRWLQPQSDVPTTEQLPLEQLGLKAFGSRHLSGVNVGGERSASTFCTKIYPAGSGAEPVIQTSACHKLIVSHKNSGHSTFITNAHTTRCRPLNKTDKQGDRILFLTSAVSQASPFQSEKQTKLHGGVDSYVTHCKKRGMIKIN